ncbi:MAG: hypothetical protein IKE55_12425 [Kiritimatiellae bacterium]|nr:hypothetical protein [Kiritimatiellia bacterium]
MKKLLIIGVVAVSLSASAADVVFTGGADGSSRDLSLPSNWSGGALPSASDDVGVVDAASFGTSYAVSADAALDGLRFSNVSSAMTIDGSGTLSLGAGGLTVSGTGGITLRAPMAVTAASTWSLGNGPVNSYAAISGTADLAVNDWSALHWRTAPGYGGKMNLKGNAKTAIIHVWQGAAWADTVEVSLGTIAWKFSGRVPFSTIFPGRSLAHNNTGYVNFADGNGTLVFGDGDTFTSSGHYHEIANGGLEVTGGNYTAGNAFIMGDNTGTAGWNRSGPASLLVSGGSFNGLQFHLGAFAETNRLARQTGGTATMCTYHIGGFGDFAGTVPVMEYRLEGGTIQDKNGAARDRGLIMGSIAAAANNRTPSGIFTQTGGQANFARLYWGAKGGFYTWDDYTTTPNGRAYGLIDLRGGEFIIPSGGFEINPMWNGGAVSNSTYDIRLSGGRVATRTSGTIPLAMTVERGEGPSTWDTGVNNVLVSAPVDGEGTLRKAGSGSLQLTDATRFKGSVAVDQGVLEIRGTIAAPEGYTEGQNLFVFSADSLAGSLADGDNVTSWTDSTGTLSCQKPVSGEISNPDSYAVPTFKPNVANGHAALYFNEGHALAFHSADNPLVGETNFSFAVVFRPTSAGVGTGGSLYAGRCIIGNDRNWSNNGPNNIALIHTGNNRATLHFRNNQPNVGDLGRVYMVPTLYQGYNEGVENLSVAIVSVSGNKVVYNFNNNFTNQTFETISGNFNPRFMNGNTKYPLYFGTSDVDNTGPQAVRCFGGYIYEARFYKGRALTEAETRSVMDELSRKYYDPSRADGYLLASSGPAAATFADTRTAPATPTAVAEWTPEFMNETFGAWDANYNKPELVANACNGKSALRFDAARNTVLKIPAGDNQDPLAGQYQFAIAVVFRTTTEGTGLADATVGTGLYSSMLAGYGHGSGCGNASLSFREYGAVGGYLATNGRVFGSLVNPRKPCRLNDGLPHVAVFTGDSKDASTGVFRLMVDGVYTENTMGYATPWPGYDSSRPHVIGALRAGVGHFTGEIMGFTFWRSFLTEDEMLAICQKAALDYGFNLKERRAFSAAELTTRGIAATNYTVAAGATLRMPCSTTAPFTVGPGTTFSGAGAFEGSYRFANGGVADFGGVTAAMEDVQIADGGVMKFGADAVLPVPGANVSSISGRVVVDVTGSPAISSGRSHTTLMTIDADRIASGTEFSIVGTDQDATIVYNEKRHGLILRLEHGFFIRVH